MENSQRLEREVRCFNCGKFLTKVVVDLDIPDWVLTKAKELGIVIEDKGDGLFFLANIGIELKIGTETKCTRCKEMDAKILVA